MKLEVTIPDEVIQRAVRVWVDRGAATALDSFVSIEVQSFAERQTRLILRSKLDDYVREHGISEPIIADMRGRLHTLARRVTDQWVVAESKRLSKKARTQILAEHLASLSDNETP